MVDAKKSPKKAAAPTHPPYAQMVTDAIKGIGGKTYIFKHFKNSFRRKFFNRSNFNVLFQDVKELP